MSRVDQSIGGSVAALPGADLRVAEAFLPPLTEEQVGRLEQLVDERGLPSGTGDGHVVTRMLGFVALVGALLLGGGTALLWRPVTLLVGGP